MNNQKRRKQAREAQRWGLLVARLRRGWRPHKNQRIYLPPKADYGG